MNGNLPVRYLPVPSVNSGVFVVATPLSTGSGVTPR